VLREEAGEAQGEVVPVEGEVADEGAVLQLATDLGMRGDDLLAVAALQDGVVAERVAVLVAGCLAG
jgi:hypothetical protein